MNRSSNGVRTDPAQTEKLGARMAEILHDLRGPLGAISQEALLLVERLRCPPIESIAALQQSAARILSATARIGTLLSELAASTDGNPAQVKIAPTMVDMRRLLTDAIELSRLAAATRGIELDAAVEDDRPLCADPIQLQRAIENMLNDAIDAIGEGPGIVDVRVSSVQDGWVRISVQDTGPGLRRRLDVFRLFKTPKEGQSGLGLAVAGEIVTAHGGRISAMPRVPRGAIFHIDLPRYGPSKRNADA